MRLTGCPFFGQNVEELVTQGKGEVTQHEKVFNSEGIKLLILHCLYFLYSFSLCFQERKFFLNG